MKTGQTLSCREQRKPDSIRVSLVNTSRQDKPETIVSRYDHNQPVFIPKMYQMTPLSLPTDAGGLGKQASTYAINTSSSYSRGEHRDSCIIQRAHVRIYDQLWE